MDAGTRSRDIGVDLATPLSEVTFCVVDLETTGGSPRSCAITEVGAVRVHGGERLGAFHTLVDPGVPIPRFITHLTGIDDYEVAGAPPIEAVVPALAEFLTGAVFVAHNARFDHAFLNTALGRLDYPLIPGPPVCTARLARRVVWPDVRNVRLRTLAEYFRCAARPCHRALPDAEACAEVLHGLLDVAGRLGILSLGDLHQAVRARGRPHYGKIRLADALPRAPGIYLFRGRDGRVLYVGKSTDLRGRVKSYFYGDDRKKVSDLLAETTAVEGRPTVSELEALVLEARHIRIHQPKYNRRGKGWHKSVYLRIDPADAYPRIVVARSATRAGGGRARVLGPFPTRRAALLAQEALEEVFPIRRCTRPMRATTRFSSCALADMGRCLAPCDGRVAPERYGELVRALISSLEAPDGLLEALGARLDRLARMERFEEATLLRDRIRALAEVLSRERSDRWLAGCGRLTLRDPSGRLFRFAAGALEVPGEPTPDPPGLPVKPDRAQEVAAVRGWLSRNPVTVLDAERPLWEPVDGGARLHHLLVRLRPADELRH